MKRSIDTCDALIKEAESRSKRSDWDKTFIMTLGPHAAISRPSRRTGLCAEKIFTNPILIGSATRQIPPLAIPFMPWSYVGTDGVRLLYRPHDTYIANGNNPIIRLFIFSALGTGRVRLCEQKFLALYSIMMYAADKCCERPFYGAWNNRHNTVNGIYRMPAAIASHCWLYSELTPYETVASDEYITKPKKIQDPRKVSVDSTMICTSKLHIGPRTMQTVPIAAFAFMRHMCVACYVANCNGVTGNTTAYLCKKAPWRAVDALTRLKHAFQDRLTKIFKVLKRLHLIAVLDIEASYELFLDAKANEQHGTMVAELAYCFPRVYSNRANAFAATQHQPMVAFARHMLAGNHFIMKKKQNLRQYNVAITGVHEHFVNYGRAILATAVHAVPQDVNRMLPVVGMAEVIKTGLYPHHLFVLDRVNDNTVLYSVAFLRIMNALATGKLQLSIRLTPPVSSKQLRPSVMTKTFHSVRVSACMSWTDDAATAFCQVGNKKAEFYDAETLRYEWLADILNLYEQAAYARKTTSPQTIKLTLCGSYYNALMGTTLVNRDNHSCLSNVVAGGCFSELVDIAMAAGSHTWLPDTAISVAMHDTVCDSLAYDASDFVTGLSKDEIFGIARAEHAALDNAELKISASTALYCASVACASPVDSLIESAMFSLDENMLKMLATIKVAFKGADLLGISKTLSTRLGRGMKNGFLHTYQEEMRTLAASRR